VAKLTRTEDELIGSFLAQTFSQGVCRRFPSMADATVVPLDPPDPLCRRLHASSESFVLDQDMFTLKWTILNKYTMECRSLKTAAGTVFDMELDDDSEDESGNKMAFVRITDPAGESESRYVLDLLKDRSYEDEKGAIWLYFDGHDSAVGLSSFQEQHQLYKIGIEIGVTRCLHEFQLALYSWHDMGTRMWFRLGDLYDAMGLKGYLKRNSNKWIHHHLPSWTRFFDWIGFKNVIRLSQEVASKRRSGDYRRSLDWVSGSPVALIAILGRLANFPPSRGGSREASDAADAILDALLCRIRYPCTLNMFLSREFDWSPPRGPIAAHPICLPISADGEVLLSPMFELVKSITSYEEESTNETIELCTHIPSDFFDRTHVKLQFMLRKLSSDKTVGLWRNLVFGIASLLEDDLLAEESAVLQVSNEVLRPKFDRLHLTTQHADCYSESTLVRKAFTYWTAGRCATRGFEDCLSISFDGARVSAKKRIFGRTFTPLNVAIAWPPQV
jgi:hypothetical protein